MRAWRESSPGAVERAVRPEVLLVTLLLAFVTGLAGLPWCWGFLPGC